jgi:Ni/Co efflux regulator RcnB
MRVPMLVIALVAAPLFATVAQGQSWQDRNDRGRSESNSRRDKDDRGRKDDKRRDDDHGHKEGKGGGSVTSISGTVYSDLNFSAMQDAGELGVGGGWTVLLTGTTTMTTTTSASGAYSFSGLPVGTYTVCVTPLAGWLQTTSPDCWSTTVAAGTAYTADFGMAQAQAGQ